MLRLRINSKNSFKQKYKSFTAECGKIYQLNKNRQISNMEIKDLKKVNSLRKDQLDILKDRAKLSIKNRFEGKISNNIDELVTTKSANHNNYSIKNKVLIQNEKIKVLIATHNVGDAQTMLLENHTLKIFIEWLIFLGSISEKQIMIGI